MEITLINFERCPNWKVANEEPEWADSQMELASRGYSTPFGHEAEPTLEQQGRVLADA